MFQAEFKLLFKFYVIVFKLLAGVSTKKEIFFTMLMIEYLLFYINLKNYKTYDFCD